MSAGVLKIRNTADTAWITVGAAAAVLVPTGMVERPEFEYKDADEIYIGAGGYHHHGTKEQWVYWESQLTKAGTFSGDQWYYLYLDDSAIVTAGTSLLTASEFVWSTTAPTYSESKRGWYNGLDRCIFAVYVASGSVVDFDHSNDLVMFDSNITVYTLAYPSTGFGTTVTFRAPAFCKSVEATFDCRYPGGTSGVGYVYWREGSSSGNGHQIGQQYNSGLWAFGHHNTLRVIVNNSGQIDIKVSVANSNNKVQVNQNGWYLPKGM